MGTFCLGLGGNDPLELAVTFIMCTDGVILMMVYCQYPEWFPFEVQHPLLETKKAQLKADAAARAAAEAEQKDGAGGV